MGFDFRQAFTVAARQTVPIVRAKKLAFSFDCQTERLIFPGEIAALQGALHRLFCAVVDLLDTGFVVLTARSDRTNEGTTRLLVHAGGVGPLVHDQAVTRVIERLKLTPDLAAASNERTRSASGTCPYTGAAVTFTGVQREGVMLTFETSCVTTTDPLEALPDAHNARAWLVNVDDTIAISWTRRLQRLGWAVARFDSCEAAAQHLLASPETARPALVIVMETEGATQDGSDSLPPLLPLWSRLLYMVPAGSPTLGKAGSVNGYEVHVFPFSPDELEVFTLGAADADSATGLTQPAPLSGADLPLVLLVDDTPLNLIVGQGLVEALGYRVQTATDGLDAVEHCLKVPPHAVLMDLQMPRINGIDASIHLRELQRRGDIPPFPIIALTAGWLPEVRAACLEAGMDECLPKPLNLETLGRELRRVCTLN